MRNKKLMLVIVLLILVVGSVGVTALRNPFSGVTSRLGGLGGWIATYFHYRILVNSAIVAIILYVILNLLGINKFKEKTNKGIGLVIVLIVSYLIIISTVLNAPAGTKAQVAKELPWLWKYNFLGGIMNFLVGSEVGILRNPTRLGIFVGSFLVFLWLFHFLKVGGGEGFSNKLNIALALLIAYNLTTQKIVTVDHIIAMGQIIGVLVIYNNLQGQINNKIAAFFIALGLVLWVGYIAFPSRKGMIGFGLSFTWLGIKLGVKYIISIVLGLAFIVFVGKWIGNLIHRIGGTR